MRVMRWTWLVAIVWLTTFATMLTIVILPIRAYTAERLALDSFSVSSRGLTAVQVALAGILAQPGVIAIPKATGAAHLRENLAAVDIALSDSELKAIERQFPRPVRKAPLAMN